MLTTPRRRTLLTCLAAAVMLLASAPPAVAAPALEWPTSISRVFDWLAEQGEAVGLDFERVVGRDSAAPNMDPNGSESLPPVALDPTGAYVADSGDDGETAPNMDPDG